MMGLREAGRERSRPWLSLEDTLAQALDRRRDTGLAVNRPLISLRARRSDGQTHAHTYTYSERGAGDLGGRRPELGDVQQAAEMLGYA